MNYRSHVISFFDYLFVFVLIIYGGMASTFVRSFSFDEPLPILLPVLLSIILIMRAKVVFNKQIYLLLLFYVIYNLALIIKYKTIHPVFFGYLLVNFMVTYVAVKTLKFKLFIIYENIIYYLAIVGLGIWGIQLLMGGDNLFYLLSNIPSIDTFSTVSGGGINIVIYSIQPYISKLITNSILPRNCGFAWEPGAFAVFLCLAIFINLFIIKSKEKLNKHFWTFVLALLSSQSTTGYVIFIVIIVFYIFQKNIKVVLLIFPFLLLIIILLFSLPFMTEKISKIFEEATRVDVIVEESIGRENARNPQRFASFIITFRDFKNNPLLGYGGHVEDRWYSQIYSNIAPISGIGNLLAQYGLVGFLFFITLSINSSRFYSQSLNYKGKYLFFIIMFFITISYSLFFRTIIMSFWMFSFFESTKSEENEAEYNLTPEIERNVYKLKPGTSNDGKNN